MSYLRFYLTTPSGVPPARCPHRGIHVVPGIGELAVVLSNGDVADERVLGVEPGCRQYIMSRERAEPRMVCRSLGCLTEQVLSEPLGELPQVVDERDAFCKIYKRRVIRTSSMFRDDRSNALAHVIEMFPKRDPFTIACDM
jgi:hypothetical protein